MLADYQQVKTGIGIPITDVSQDSKVQLCLQAADAAVKKYVKRSLETSIYVHFPFRTGGEALVLPETPVLSYRLTGSISNGFATITGLSSTSNLIVGMPVIVVYSPGTQTTQPFPNGVTIQSVDSSSQVTLTGASTQTLANASIIFGLSMWSDPSGSFGDGPGTDPTGPFGATTQLYPGTDYALQRDLPDGTSGSGKIIRLGSAVGLLTMGGAWNPYFYGGLSSRGTLTSPLPPLWPKWPPGSVKISYAAGLGYGATAPDGLMPSTTTIPSDLTAATIAVAAWMFRNFDTGLLQVQSESFDGYSSSVAQAVDALKTNPALGTAAQLLSRYRKLSL